MVCHTVGRVCVVNAIPAVVLVLVLVQEPKYLAHREYSTVLLPVKPGL